MTKLLKSLALLPFVTLTVLFSASIAQAADAEKILLKENFSTLSPALWAIEMHGTAGYTVNGRVNLSLSDKTVDSVYSNSALVSRQSFSKNNFEISVLSSSFSPGSRGWGFWNGQMDPAKSAIIWFIYLEAPNYPLTGFFAVVQAPGTQPEFLPLDSTLLTSPHIYSIEWRNNVVFKVDGQTVAQSAQNMKEKMEIHLWEDNAVYDPQTFGPVLQNITAVSNIEFDDLKVTK